MTKEASSANFKTLASRKSVCGRAGVIYIGKSSDALGGPGTFIGNLENVCNQAEIYQISQDADAADIYLIVAESVSIRYLWLFWRSDRVIILRLDGKRTPLRTSLRQARVGHGIVGKVVYGLRLWRSQSRKMFRLWLALLFADGVIYQSAFVKRRWGLWEEVRQALPRRFSTVITNGVPATRFPAAIPCRSNAVGLKRIIAVKGFLRTCEMLWAVINQLTDLEFQTSARAAFPEYPLIIDVYGHIEGFDRVQARLSAYEQLSGPYPPHVWIQFHGHRSREHVDEALMDPDTVGAMLLEDRPACPNAAFEAQSVGLPVIGSRDGANPEIILFQELLLDPFQRSSKFFRVGLLKSLMFCVDFRAQDRSELQSIFRKAFGDNKFYEYFHFIDFVNQKNRRSSAT